jgi:uncharacterized protein YndB with AHSA1/START domain
MTIIDEIRLFPWLRALVVAGVVLTPARSPAEDASPTRDRTARPPEIKWPPSVDPDRADLFAHNDVKINAPCGLVWRNLVSAGRWPRWYPNAADVAVSGGGKDGTLRLGSRFSWRTFGLDVKSEVVELVPAQRLAWTGKTSDIDAYHTWYLADDGGGCQVVTEEAANGAGARALVAKDPGAMHRGHDLWLATLKKVSER